MRSPRAERGSVSVVVAAAVGMALVVTMGMADVGRALIARTRAEAVADLAALAAAQELAFPSGADPASIAADYADRNQARVVSCDCAVGTSEAVVEVAVPVRGFLLPLMDREVRAVARAVVDLPPEPSSTAIDSRQPARISAFCASNSASVSAPLASRSSSTLFANRRGQ